MRIGMYGGSFDPLHIEHVRNIIRASRQVDKLYVVLSHSKTRDHFPMEKRYRWLLNTFKTHTNIEIVPVEDFQSSKQEYDWELGKQQLLDLIDFNVVFAGTDYQESKIFETLYPDKEIVYFQRTEISSTLIRENPLKYWTYIPKIVQREYVKKVLILGGKVLENPPWLKT